MNATPQPERIGGLTRVFIDGALTAGAVVD